MGRQREWAHDIRLEKRGEQRAEEGADQDGGVGGNSPVNERQHQEQR